MWRDSLLAILARPIMCHGSPNIAQRSVVTDLDRAGADLVAAWLYWLFFLGMFAPPARTRAANLRLPRYRL